MIRKARIRNRDPQNPRRSRQNLEKIQEKREKLKQFLDSRSENSYFLSYVSTVIAKGSSKEFVSVWKNHKQLGMTLQ